MGIFEHVRRRLFAFGWRVSLVIYWLNQTGVPGLSGEAHCPTGGGINHRIGENETGK